MKWDDAVSYLHYTDELDCICGMEITESRQKKFDFTTPYYSRNIAVFVRNDNKSITTLKDLIGKKLTADKDSTIESLLKEKGLFEKIRIKETFSKEESMKLLKKREFDAMIAPKEVGIYLAEKYKVKVKIIAIAEDASPVAIAVKKGNLELLNLLEKTLQELIKEGEIEKVYNNWFK